MMSLAFVGKSYDTNVVNPRDVVQEVDGHARQISKRSLLAR